MSALAQAHAALRRHWGYSSFRPLQERIIASVLAGRDVCVVMPTGGGKSLCYQLPAALWGERTVVVVSPLLALMQDQVRSLAARGIPAAAINSTLTASQQSQVQTAAAHGQYRLLYLSPERLARDDTRAWLRRLPLALFAIDEAHCISEWGHEFRPEYRQLRRLREEFPEVSIAAFTASATHRVRHDILSQLQLRTPEKFIASFHRPNLRYLVRATDAAEQPGLLLQALAHHAGARVIVYAPTIARVGETVALLQSRKIGAVAYHGQMDAKQRRENQESWMSARSPVLVGTLAFGLGIDQPEVRAVIHLALPKSIEQYYQEAGRAGRDGQPADCLLLWQRRDAGLLGHFAEQIEDAEERERAWQRFHDIKRFAAGDQCRHRQICLHFGERPRWQRCGACDVCGAAAEYLHAPASEGRLRKSRKKRPELPTPGPESSQLRERLRQWRLAAARERGVPAYQLFTDRSLDALCAERPSTLEELAEVYGFSPAKAGRIGPELLGLLAAG